MNMKKIGIFLGIVVLLAVVAVAAAVMTRNDEGLGLQLEEIPANGINEIVVISQYDSVIVKQGGTDTITLSLMRNHKDSSNINYSLENGKLTVTAVYQTSFFNLSLNPDRMKDEPLQITLPDSAAISILTIQAEGANEVTVEPVNVNFIKITTTDSNIRMIGMEGTVDAQTLYGKITSSVELSSEIEKGSDDSYSYRGQIGVPDKNNRSITILSDSGNIIFE